MVVSFINSRQDLEELVPFLADNTSPPKIIIRNMGRWKACPADLALLCGALVNNTTVDEIQFDGPHSIGTDGMQHIAELLKSNHSIKRIGFASIDIDDDVASTLASALPHNQGLTEITIRGSIGESEVANCVHDQGVTALAKALEQNSSLKVLKLPSETPMSDEAIEALGKMLHINTTLESFGCNASGASRNSIMELVRGVANHPAITGLMIAGEVDREWQQQAEEILNRAWLPNLVGIKGQIADTFMAKHGKSVAYHKEARKDANWLLLKKESFESFSPQDLYKLQVYYPRLYFDPQGEEYVRYLDSLPTVPVDEELTLEKLLDKPEGGGFAAIHNPRMLEQFTDIAHQLVENGRPIGVADLLDKGKPNEFFELIIGSGNVSAIFTLENWRGAEQQMRAAYNAMPNEGKKQVHDWPRLQGDVARTPAPNRER